MFSTFRSTALLLLLLLPFSARAGVTCADVLKSLGSRLAEATCFASAGDRRPAYRLYEIQNGNHIETFQDVFPQLELIEPHAQRAFDLLVRQVESNVPLPHDQCVARGATISDSPAQAGRCASLFVP